MPFSPVFRQMVEQGVVLLGAGAVSQALHLEEANRPPDALRSCLFPCVGGGVEAHPAGLLVEVREWLRRETLLGTAEPYADDSKVLHVTDLLQSPRGCR